MAKIDDDLDANDVEEKLKPKIDNKKALIITIPVLIILASAVSFFTIFRDSGKEEVVQNYHVVTKPAVEGANATSTVFYDLPEINIQIKSPSGEKNTLRIKVGLEVADVKQVETINALAAKINDIIISHTIELTPDEIGGITGLHWLKEELLHRINLVSDPVQVNDINFKTFEIQTKE